ncbi:glycerophosphodiester phosphodiesterase family protein [Bacillus anthracis]|uniref:glycerophosphodiester phosphodiesterase family protein n=1 Tax=Bacillus anthracis TaxID=1392 RepID=UPI002DBBA948|nr:glycerophosphodiester phosphodiesterase family protein [Bacillus anthracis]MEB9507359.1 glycerophosphodiester phosphodiesterase family protein [Bacillus anthracis]
MNIMVFLSDRRFSILGYLFLMLFVSLVIYIDSSFKLSLGNILYINLVSTSFFIIFMSIKYLYLRKYYNELNKIVEQKKNDIINRLPRPNNNEQLIFHCYLDVEAAFEAGADVVEIDIQPTQDGEFAIFHDWTLDCRTDGSGVTRDHTMSELRKLDIGYGYTADGGKTYPFRGKGLNQMPTLNEVLRHFSDKEFLIHIKSDDPMEGTQLAEYLSQYPEERIDDLSVYGGDKPIKSLKNSLSDIRVMSKETLKSCLLSYEILSWTGYIPGNCKNTQIHVPEKYASYLWGFPNKFINRMEKVNTRVILVAGDGDWSEGFDKKSDLERLPKSYKGGIWTNRIDNIAPIIND